jgi:hypothetical protein
MEVSNPAALQKIPWNKGKLVGQKPVQQGVQCSCPVSVTRGLWIH